MFIYQIKVSLPNADPPIWRRIQIHRDSRLGKLHRILQAVMGWTDSHLHQFMAGDTACDVPAPDFPSDMKSERNVRPGRVSRRIFTAFDLAQSRLRRDPIDRGMVTA